MLEGGGQGLLQCTHTVPKWVGRRGKNWTAAGAHAAIKAEKRYAQHNTSSSGVNRNTGVKAKRRKTPKNQAIKEKEYICGIILPDTGRGKPIGKFGLYKGVSLSARLLLSTAPSPEDEAGLVRIAGCA